jgi:hypothetical protein
MFEKLDYTQWCKENDIAKLFDIDLNTYGTIDTKQPRTVYEAVDPKNLTPYPPELDDLIRLHYLARTRRVTTILEFGSGKSTVVFAHALAQNKAEFNDYVMKNIRRGNPFEIHSVDINNEWVETCKNNIPEALHPFVHFTVCDVDMTTFNGRACTMYASIPNVCPDLIYLDGPDQHCAKGDVRGISTRGVDRLPMSADILVMEPFLLPGTLIVVDGRTANARFLRNNLQRNWGYRHHTAEDVHTFELTEEPLGKLNARQVSFCLNHES